MKKNRIVETYIDCWFGSNAGRNVCSNKWPILHIVAHSIVFKVQQVLPFHPYSSHMLRRISLPLSPKLGSRDTLRDRWRNGLIFLHEDLNTPLGLGNQNGEVYSHTYLNFLCKFRREYVWALSYIPLLHSFHWTFNFNV